MDKEIWKDIEGFNGVYQVSNMGNVRKIVDGLPVLKKANPNKRGYCIVITSKEKRRVTYQVHRLVAIAFIANPNNYELVNHINGVKNDNRAINLEWCTPKQNIHHALENGLSDPHKQPKRRVAKLLNGEIIKIYDTTSELTKDGFDRRAIYQCIAGKERRKTHKGFEWKFVDDPVVRGIKSQAPENPKYKKHGKSSTREYLIWKNIKSRCYNIKQMRYDDYGGRGIRMCDSWLEGFYNFYKDMGPAPSKNHSIDRIDYNGNYEPGNCRWATIEIQANNKRKPYRRYITANGQTLPISVWAKKLGLSVDTIISRLKKGWSETDAVTKAKIVRKRK